MEQSITFKADIANFQFIQEPLKVSVGEKEYVFEPDVSKSFFHFDLLSSYPTFNSNKLTFTLPILAKAFATAMYNPLDIEHILEGNPGIFDPEKDANRIIGAMILSYLPGIEKYGDDVPLVPDAPIPMRIVGVAWKRIADAQDLLQGMANGVKWGTSMEVIRNSSEDMYVNPETNEFYELGSVPEDLKDKVVLAVGGKGDKEKTTVNFWGGGFTLSQADRTANILSLNAAMANKGEMTMKIDKSKTDKSNIEKLFADTNKIIIITDGSASGTIMQIGEEQVAFESLWLSCSKDNRDDRVYMDFSVVKEKIGDFVVYQRYELKKKELFKAEGDEDMNIIQQAKKELKEEGYKSASEIEKEISTVKEGFKDFVSPDKQKELVDQAVKDKAVEIEKAVKEKYDILFARLGEMEKEGIKVTVSRKEKIISFKTDEAGNKEFKEYLDSIKASIADMEKVLKEKNVELNDNLKAKISAFNGVDDLEFKALIDGISMIASKASGDDRETFVFSPTGGDIDKNKDPFAGMHK